MHIVYVVEKKQQSMETKIINLLSAGSKITQKIKVKKSIQANPTSADLIMATHNATQYCTIWPQNACKHSRQHLMLLMSQQMVSRRIFSWSWVRAS